MKTLTLLISLILLAACAQNGTTTVAGSTARDHRSNSIGISNEPGGTEIYGSMGIRAKIGK